MNVKVCWIALSLMTAAGGTGCASAGPPAPCAPTTTAAGTAPDDLDKLTDEQLARRLMELTGAANLGKQMGTAMAEQMKKMPGMPAGFMDRFSANIHPDELTALLVPIYVKELDHETLLAVVRFYETKSGRVLIGKLPLLTQESMEVGKQWGGALAKKTLEEMGIAPPKGP
jgi:hypothetical protein